LLNTSTTPPFVSNQKEQKKTDRSKDKDINTATDETDILKRQPKIQR